MSAVAAVVVALAPLGTALVKAGLSALEGKSKEEVARETIDALIASIPREELIGHLTARGFALAELAADAAEREKFGASQ